MRLNLKCRCRKEVAKNYIRDFFFIDFICCVPGFPLSVVLEKTLSASGDEATLLKLGKAPRVLKVVRTLKMVKVFRVLKIARTIQDIKDTVRGLGTVFKLLRLFCFTIFVLNLLFTSSFISF